MLSFTLIEINLPLKYKGSSLPYSTNWFNKNTPSKLDKLCAYTDNTFLVLKKVNSLEKKFLNKAFFI